MFYSGAPCPSIWRNFLCALPGCSILFHAAHTGLPNLWYGQGKSHKLLEINRFPWLLLSSLGHWVPLFTADILIFPQDLQKKMTGQSTST